MFSPPLAHHFLVLKRDRHNRREKLLTLHYHALQPLLGPSSITHILLFCFCWFFFLKTFLFGNVPVGFSLEHYPSKLGLEASADFRCSFTRTQAVTSICHLSTEFRYCGCCKLSRLRSVNIREKYSIRLSPI